MLLIVTDRETDYIFVTDFDAFGEHLDSIINQACRSVPPSTPTPATSAPHIGESTLQYLHTLISTVVLLKSANTAWVKKWCHPNHGYNFVNSWSICKILSLLQRAVNVQQNLYNVTHHTLSMLLHYLEKLKNQKFAVVMHVEHVSNVTFYHLSNRCLPNVMKINVKINTIPTFCFLYVYCPWDTEGVLNCGMVRFPTSYYWHCSWPVEKAAPGMCPCKCGHFEHLLWTNSCKQFTFSCVFGSSGFCPSCQLFTVLMLDGWQVYHA